MATAKPKKEIQKKIHTIFDDMPKVDDFKAHGSIPIGVPAIDIDCLKGGLALGGWVEAYAEHDNCKTTLAMFVGASLQRLKPNKALVWIDTENKFMPDYARKIGMTVPENSSTSPLFRYHAGVGMERMLEKVIDYLQPDVAPHIGGIVLDSLAGLRPAKYLDGSKFKVAVDKKGKSTGQFSAKEMALFARIFADINPKIVDCLLALDPADWPLLFFTNQVRDYTDGSVDKYTRMENRVKSPGGRSKEHYVIQKLFLYKEDKLVSNAEGDIGVRFGIRAVRNITGSAANADGKNIPKLTVFYGAGGYARTLVAPTLDDAIRFKFIKVNGSWLEIPGVVKVQGQDSLLEFLMEHQEVVDELLLLCTERRRELRDANGDADDADDLVAEDEEDDNFEDDEEADEEAPTKPKEEPKKKATGAGLQSTRSRLSAKVRKR